MASCFTFFVSFSLSFVICSCYDWAYTETAYTLSGRPCMTNCVMRKCVINDNKDVSLCEPTGLPAPIYFTSQKRNRDPTCLSRCGLFGNDYEWCITSEAGDWDYCNSAERQPINKTLPLSSRTINLETCWGHRRYCAKYQNKRYYWCTINDNDDWNYCAPLAEHRIPILPTVFENSTSLCFGREKDIFKRSEFIAYLSPYIMRKPTDIIEKDYTSLLTVVLDPNRFFTSYHVLVVDLPLRKSVPVSIRLTLTKENVKNKVNLAGIIRKHLGEVNISPNKNNVIIEFDPVRSTPVLESPHWSKLEEIIDDWPENTKLDVHIVIFYSDYTNPIPSAFGLTMSRRNYKSNVKESCNGIVLFNKKNV